MLPVTPASLCWLALFPLAWAPESGPWAQEPASSAAALEAAAREVAIPELTLESIALWRDYLRPRPDELAWLAIPWLTTFAEGVQRAHEEEKPLLFWAMNGHPLGCT